MKNVSLKFETVFFAKSFRNFNHATCKRFYTLLAVLDNNPITVLGIQIAQGTQKF